VVRFTLLGLVRVAVGDREVPLSPKERTVLAALLLRAGEVVSVAALAEAIWDDAPPPSARNTIQGHVKRLRRLLGPASARIVTRAPGYLIEVRPGELDSRTVTELRAQAGAEARAGEWARAARLLRDAITLWTGEPLADVPSAFLQRTNASRLAELRLDALEECAEADLRLGRNEACAADLRALAAGHPFRERLWELLMLALYRAGRQGDALSAYQQAREALRDGLGVDPGRRLQDLHARVLAADPALSQDPAPAADQGLPAGAHGGARAADRETPRQLPAMLPDFTGRRDEASRLRDSLIRPGCVAVIAGPGGVGKTALAVHAAHQMAARFPDGQMFIRLGGAASPAPPAALLGRLLRDLGVPDSGIPADEDERAARYRTLLADRTALIVLDDARSAAQVRPLLPGAGGSAVIVTSRVTLADLFGAAFTELAVLGADESRAMLASIAGERRIASDPDGTDGIVSSCAGLPLAIRIAGSRLATSPGWTVGQLSGLLSRERQRLGELAVGDTAVRATFEVSYLSLPAGDPEPARVFRLFGLAGLPTLSLPALAALAGTPVTRTAGAAAALVDAHLLESPEPGRFQAHDLLGIYAAERAAADETDRSRRDALRRLLAWYQHALNACVQEFSSMKEPVPLEPPGPCVPAPGITTLAEALQWLEAEQSNLVPAVMLAASEGLTDSCWRLAWLMRHYFDWYGRWGESVAVLEAGLSAAEASGNKAAIAALSNGMGAVLWKLGQLEGATDRYGRALAIRRELGDKKGASTVLANLGLVEIASGRVASAIGRFQEALAVNRDLEYRFGEALCLTNLGYAYEASGRFREALAAYEEGLAIRVRHCSLNNQAASLHSIGALLITMERVDDAMDYLHRSLKICQDNNVGYGEGLTLASLGDGYLALGKPADAQAAWRRAHDILAEIGATEAAAVRERLANLVLPVQTQPENRTVVTVVMRPPLAVPLGRAGSQRSMRADRTGRPTPAGGR
jgi:DNA-binding SARP family transcriptional activator